MGSAQWQDAVFIDGEFRKPAGGGTLGVRDKASGEIFATAGLASEADVDRAVAAAAVAQPDWAMRTYAERATVLRDAAAVLGDRAKELRELIMRETGCIGGKADYEIGAATSELIEAAALASRSPGELVPTQPTGEPGEGNAQPCYIDHAAFRAYHARAGGRRAYRSVPRHA